MKRKRCDGCEIIIDRGEKTHKIVWPNSKGEKVKMEFCTFCYNRRLIGIPIEGNKPKKETNARKKIVVR